MWSTGKELSSWVSRCAVLHYVVLNCLYSFPRLVLEQDVGFDCIGSWTLPFYLILIGLHPPSLIRVFAIKMKEALVLSYPLGAQRNWSDWADAQADLSLRWVHSHCWFCYEVAHTYLQYHRQRSHWDKLSQYTWRKRHHCCRTWTRTDWHSNAWSEEYWCQHRRNLRPVGHCPVGSWKILGKLVHLLALSDFNLTGLAKNVW